MKPYGPEYKPRAPKPKAPPAKYQWPANKITPDDMAILYHLRARTGTPINKLLQEAIRKFGEVSLPQAESTTRDAEATSEDSGS
ncbi:hypothetical protein HUU05_14770 [candidate division KSB1 bacterium]|nr:hypothetical protein [candidate division KSB1 bacterium]